MLIYTVRNVTKDFDIFVQKSAQNAGNAILETQNSNIFRGGVHPDPLAMSCHFSEFWPTKTWPLDLLLKK